MAALFPDADPVLVVGAARSGTTLLQRMLDSHPELSVLDELTYFNGILQLRPAVPDLAAPGAVERFFELLPRLDQYPYWNGMEDVFAEVRRRLAADTRPSYEAFYLHAMQAHAARGGKRRYGDKTPENLRSLDELAAIFGRLQVVHIVRDPRANVASRKATEWSSADVVTNTLKWRLDVTAARRFAAMAAPGAYHELRYEDLVTEPEATLSRVCAFLGVGFAPAMLDTERKAALFRNSSWKDNALRPVSTDSVARWRTTLGRGQLGLIQATAGPMLRQHGYAPERLTAVDWLRAGSRAPVELGRWLRFKLARRPMTPGAEFHAGSADLWRSLRRSLGLGGR